MRSLKAETTPKQLRSHDRCSLSTVDGLRWQLFIKNGRGSSSMVLTGVVFAITDHASAAETGEHAFALHIENYAHAITRREWHECMNDQIFDTMLNYNRGIDIEMRVNSPPQ